MGCAVVNFNEGKCYITTMGQREVVEHERLHCQGYDHFGETTMADLWQRWKDGQSYKTIR